MKRLTRESSRLVHALGLTAWVAACSGTDSPRSGVDAGAAGASGSGGGPHSSGGSSSTSGGSSSTGGALQSRPGPDAASPDTAAPSGDAASPRYRDGGAGHAADGSSAPLRDGASTTPLDASTPPPGNVFVDRPDGSTSSGCPGFAIPSPACNFPLCGNGQIDSCKFCPTCSPASESCDGAKLGGATCLSLGYTGGSVSCGAWCGFDASQCGTCVHGPHVLACGRADLASVDPHALVMAATETEFAVAWIASGEAHLARFRPDLSMIMETGCFDAEGTALSLAVTPSGYLLAVDTFNNAGIELHPLTATGRPRARIRLVADQLPYLATRREPGKAVVGGPLFVHGTSARIAELLDDDGLPESSPKRVVSAPLWPPGGSGVFTGNGFLYAERDMTKGVVIVQMGLDGKVVKTTSPFSSSTDYPELAWSGTEGRLTYSQFFPEAQGTFWARTDASGALLGSSTQLGTTAGQFNRSPLVTIGDDSLVFLGGYSGVTAQAARMDVTRLSPVGATVTPVYQLVQDPARALSPQLVTVGNDAIAAWLQGGYPGGILLARLKP